MWGDYRGSESENGRVAGGQNGGRKLGDRNEGF